MTKAKGEQTAPEIQYVSHEVVINGEVRFSTQIPADMDPGVYDSVAQSWDEAVRSEASAGRKGAEDSLALAIRLNMCGGLESKSYRQLCQEPAYSDLVANIYATHGKSRGAYSQHRTLIREDKSQLRELLKKNVGVTGKVLDELTEKWALDPNRVKNGGGPKKTKETDVSFTATEVIGDEVTEDEDDDAAGEGTQTESLRGMVGACTTRLKKISRKDVLEGGNPADFLNDIRALAKEVDAAKMFAAGVLKMDG